MKLFPPRFVIFAAGIVNPEDKETGIAEAKQYVKKHGFTMEDVKISCIMGDDIDKSEWGIFVITKREVELKDEAE